METAIIEPSLELSQLKLQNFWRNLPQELQKHIGLRVSFLMGLSAFTLDPIELILDTEELSQLEKKPELSSIVNEIRTLDSASQWKIKHQLMDYFLSRNS
ncbi:hypothetical protein K2X92_03880 [Candidatus Gracilibacteria bacterium]|nr:hypothetical protein [Candidatus Gracilibacteria bacterium]